MAEPHPHAQPALVQRRPARRQPGPRPAHECRGKAGVLRPARADRIQGDRGRFPLRLPDRIRLHPAPDRGEPDSRRTSRSRCSASAAKTWSLRTLESIAGAKNVIFHLYNSTSPKQREYVFNAPKEEIVRIAVAAVKLLKERMQPLVAAGSRIRLEYSPGELHEHRARVRARNLRGGDRRLAADGRGQDHPQPAGNGRIRHAERPCRPDRVDVHPPDPPRQDHRLPAHAQRPRDGGRRDGAGAARRCGPGGGDAFRKRRAHREPRHRQCRPEPLHARDPPGPRLLGHQPHPRRLRTLHAAGGPRAAALCGRARLHRIQRLAPGCHQEILGPPQARGALGRPLHTDRSRRHRAQLQGDHPDQLAVREGRRRLCPRARVRLHAARSSCTGRSAGSSTTSPTQRAPS